MDEILYPLNEMEDTASIIQKHITQGRLYKTHLSNFLSEVNNLPADIAPNIENSWRNWYIAVQSHFQAYGALAQNTSQGASLMEEQDKTDAQGFTPQQ
jgi:uncharacterized protein YukE